VSSKQGNEEFPGAKTYPKVGAARKQSRFESYRKLAEFYEDESFRKASFKH